MSFWPDSIDVHEVLTPAEIMGSAGEELSLRTGGKLTARVRSMELEDRICILFIVRRTDFNLRHDLFHVFHQKGEAYPVVIDPPADQLPDFLKRETFVAGSPGVKSIGAMNLAMMHELTRPKPGYTVTNEWVCSTPEEFSAKLTKLFSLDHVVQRMLNLLAARSTTTTRQQTDPQKAGEQIASDHDRSASGDDPTQEVKATESPTDK